ncbi:hypothetical protein [Chamaesiphon sp. VAR_48_metabat_403]|nr:hypothetical protein [Chamaesiphon sp. VAR_48_metabat_403]
MAISIILPLRQHGIDEDLLFESAYSARCLPILDVWLVGIGVDRC